MKNPWYVNTALVGCLMLYGVCGAQEVVHALAGSVVSIDKGSKTITIKTDDGSDGRFSLPQKADGSLDFDKAVKAETIPAAAFTKTDTQVLVYFTGYNSVRTAVALEDLGTDPLNVTVGTVRNYDKHTHQLTVVDGKGTKEMFVMNGETVAEGMNGAKEGEKAVPDKGVKVRVVAKGTGAGATALFVRALSL